MKNLISLLLTDVILLLCSGCRVLYFEPPTVESMDSFVTEHYEIIKTVSDYLLSFDSIDYKYIYVQENGRAIELYWSSGRKTDNPFSLTIEDEDVLKSIAVLRREGCNGISKRSDRNAVYFNMWINYLGEADCGFACPIDPSEEPQIDFQTEIAPLSKDNWYYVLSVYEEWRVQNR